MIEAVHSGNKPSEMLDDLEKEPMVSCQSVQLVGFEGRGLSENFHLCCKVALI